MKTRNFLWGLLACAAFSACSSDEVDSGTKEFKDKAYMRVQIAMAGNPSSRGTGGEYEYGTSNEQKINDITFFFYDSSNKFVTKGEAINNTNVTQNGTDEEYWEAETAPIISLKLDESQPFPTQVVAYVNIGTSNVNFGEESSRTLDSDGLKVAQSATLNPDAFVMTSSTYLDGSNVVCSTPVYPKNFHETEQAAKDDTELVTIYVERLPAKVIVNQAAVDIDDIEDASGNLLRFSVTGFVLNGLNTDSYLQKQVDNTWSFTSWSGAWNVKDEFRCFWAKDMNYDVSSSAPSLDFVSYGEISTPTADAKYCYENTLALPLTEDTNKNLFANATHVLLFGEYQMKKAGESDFEELTESFYMYAGTAYLGNDLKTLWADAVTDVYVKGEGDTYSKADESKYNLVSDGSVDGVTLALMEGDYYKKTGESTYESWDISEKNNSLKEIYKATGYLNAVGYFPILIEHFGIGTDADNYETTELGVVRNHIYNIEIQSIKSLAEGVFNPDIPIIPDSSVKTYYLASKLRILSWKTVSQSVEL